MSKIKIKNFGPIKEGYVEDDGFLEIKKVTIFIGNQGSGKSTLAKLISTMMWFEKARNRRDFDEFSYMSFWNNFNFHGLKDYFYEFHNGLKKESKHADIVYCGEKFCIRYPSEKWPTIEIMESQKYITPKIMYVPAERNTLSTISNIKGIPDNLLSFYEELRRANKELNGKKLKLPINNYSYEYNDTTDTSYIVGSDYMVDIKNASSGAQSFTPLYVVTQNLANLVAQPDEVLRKSMNANSILQMNEAMSNLEFNDSIPEIVKAEKRLEIRNRFLSKCFINIIEEPEQNLYPTSQRSILNSLLDFNNMSDGNKLIMTTHSPYIISYLSLAIQADYLKNKIKSPNLLKKLDEIVPLASTISANNVAIYQFDEKNGTIRKLPMIEGIPSDKNFFNQSLADGNDLFDQLLEIEQES